jgi:hypothetical protein
MRKGKILVQALIIIQPKDYEDVAEAMYMTVK